MVLNVSVCDIIVLTSSLLSRIAGWNQKSRPFLSTAFHIGDRVVSIDGQPVDSIKTIHRLIKQCKEGERLTFIINRMPAGKLYLFRREWDGQDLGLKRMGGTGEVSN